MYYTYLIHCCKYVTLVVGITEASQNQKLCLVGFERKMAAANEDLADFEEEEVESKTAVAKKSGASSYSGIHSSAFKDFLLKPEINRAIVDAAFEHPSEIQHEAIPSAIMGMDVICQAKSGMGKTAVFVLTTLHQLEPEKGVVSVLVLCNTRELAYQIHGEYERFGKYLKDLKMNVIFGGKDRPVSNDITLLSNPDTVPNVIIGTPGRILDLIKRKALKLDKVRHFVIDECDSLLSEPRMRGDCQLIFRETPHNKQVMLFSATLPPEIRPVCKLFTNNPKEIFVDDEQKLRLHGLTQYVARLLEQEKNRKLTQLLDALSFNQVIIFVNTKDRATSLCKLLVDSNFPSIEIHGDSTNRIELLEKFKKFQARILVSTDLMGRGIDVERVNVTINYDFPKTSEDYLHRVNRAGRFGTKGLSISFVSSPTDEEILSQVEARFGNKVPNLPDEIDSSTYMNA